MSHLRSFFTKLSVKLAQRGRQAEIPTDRLAGGPPPVLAQKAGRDDAAKGETVANKANVPPRHGAKIGCGVIIAGAFVLSTIFVILVTCSESRNKEADNSPAILAQKAQFLDALHAEKMPLERFGNVDVIYSHDGISLFVEISKENFEKMTESAASRLNVTAWAQLVSKGLVLFELHFAQTHNIPVKGHGFFCSVALHDHGITGQETVAQIGYSDYEEWRDDISWNGK